MDDQKLAETVLLQLECFYVIQELDEAFRVRKQSARTFLAKIYSRRPVKFDFVYPLLRRTTTLNLLALPIAFVCRLSDRSLSELKFEIKQTYNLECYENGEASSLSAKEILLVLRNAIAHTPDFATDPNIKPNISFDGESTRFWTRKKSKEIVLTSEIGFHFFISDLINTCRTAARMLIQDC
jgi:hypothetical protein